MERDGKRTGVKATMIPWSQPPLELINDRWHGPYGAFIGRTFSEDDVHLNEAMYKNHWLLCCPGCGQMSSPRDGARWTCDVGSFGDVTTLTLSPSIAMGCCGWHGYLRNGIFVSI